eukprot:1397378-Alexandrium_andersonii.AAC.1
MRAAAPAARSCEPRCGRAHKSHPWQHMSLMRVPLVRKNRRAHAAGACLGHSPWRNNSVCRTTREERVACSQFLCACPCVRTALVRIALTLV